MSDRASADARRYAGGTGYDWRQRVNTTSSTPGSARVGQYYNSVKTGQAGITGTTTSTSTSTSDSSSVSGSSYTQIGPNMYQRKQDRYFTPVGLYMDIPTSPVGLAYSSPRPVIQDEATAVARWDAPLGSPDALPDWLREQVKQMAYEYYDREVPDSWVRGFWEKAVNSAAELGDNATALQSMYTKVLSDEGDTSGGGGYSSYGGYGGGGYGGGGGGAGSVALTDPTSARGLLMQTMQGVLGRDPTRGEVREFLKILNESEMSNPRTVEMDGDVAVQSGGIDPSVLALDFAQDAEDFEQVRGDEFFQTFMRALAGV